MPYDKNWAKKLKLNVKRELKKGGKHSPAGIRYMKTLQKPKPTLRTKASDRIESRLRRAGLTEAEIKKMR